MSHTIRSPRCHTFSIVARDPSTGQMGVAVQSHWFSVGTVVCWAKAGIGAVATQSIAETSYGPLGLELMSAGKNASQTLKALLAVDRGKETRQVAMVDAEGRVAAHTGKRCISAASHIVGEGFSVQANMMLKDTVPAEMYNAYMDGLKDSSIDLAERMLLALDAAQADGGDIRGMQSAAILVVEPDLRKASWEGIVMDLRVEDHPDPLNELRRLVNIQKAYTFMNKGDELLAEKKVAEAFIAYQAAERLAPHILEIPFWNAVTLADTGLLDEALPIFRKVFKKGPVWAELLKRLPPVDMFTNDPAVLEKILALL